MSDYTQAMVDAQNRKVEDSRARRLITDYPAVLKPGMDTSCDGSRGPHVFKKPTRSEKLAERERDMHDALEVWLRGHGIFYVHSRMDKASSIQVGIPDFVVLHKGIGICVELKMPGKKATTEQLGFIAQLRKGGNAAEICYSAEDAIEFVRTAFAI